MGSLGLNAAINGALIFSCGQPCLGTQAPGILFDAIYRRDLFQSLPGDTRIPLHGGQRQWNGAYLACRS